MPKERQSPTYDCADSWRQRTYFQGSSLVWAGRLKQESSLDLRRRQAPAWNSFSIWFLINIYLSEYMRTTCLHTLSSIIQTSKWLEKKDICSGTTMLITTEVLQQSNLEEIAIGKKLLGAADFKGRRYHILREDCRSSLHYWLCFRSCLVNG